MAASAKDDVAKEREKRPPPIETDVRAEAFRAPSLQLPIGAASSPSVLSTASLEDPATPAALSTVAGRILVHVPAELRSMYTAAAESDAIKKLNSGHSDISHAEVRALFSVMEGVPDGAAGSVSEPLASSNAAASPGLVSTEVGGCAPIDFGHKTSMNSSDKGLCLPFSRIALLLRTVLDPPFSEYEVEMVLTYTDSTADGMINIHEFCVALNTGSIRHLVRQLHRDKIARGEVTKAATVDRNLLQERVAWRVERDDAFFTLPVTLVFMMTFFVLIVSHLQVWNRQQVERGLDSWLRGAHRDEDSPRIADVKDPAMFRHWLLASGVEDIFGSVRERTDGGTGHHVRLANTNLLLGDVTLTRKVRSDDGEEVVAGMQGILETDVARTYLAANDGDFAGAALAALGIDGSPEFDDWYGDDTSELALSFCTFSPRSRFFAVVECDVPFREFGYVVPSCFSTAVMSEPYSTQTPYVFDVIYILLILYIVKTELRDLISAARLGWHELQDYCDRWNTIDWLNIAVGLLWVGNWVYCCHAMSDDFGVLNESGELSPDVDVMALRREAIAPLREKLDEIIARFLVLHLITVLTSVLIMLKFFKGFRSNPRLNIVVETLGTAAEDIIHFFIVFFIIFISFALMGHVLFGGDTYEFYTLASSVKTSFKTLMGDFGWFMELDSNELESNELQSGMPSILVTLWFIFFMVFVLLVLLNMLLAVVLEKYVNVASMIKAQTQRADDAYRDSDAGGMVDNRIFSDCGQTIFRQMREVWIRYRCSRETKGFIALERLRAELDNDNNPAHAEKDGFPTEVTAASLQEAFKTMDARQAEWLMVRLRSEADLRVSADNEEDDEMRIIMDVARDTERHSRTIAHELRLVSLAVQHCNSQLNEFADDMDAFKRVRTLPSSGAAPPGEEVAPAAASQALLGREEVEAELERRARDNQGAIRGLQDSMRQLSTMYESIQSLQVQIVGGDVQQHTTQCCPLPSSFGPLRGSAAQNGSREDREEVLAAPASRVLPIAP